MPITEKVVCSNPGCRIAETGQCLEGLSPAQCPHRTVVSHDTELKPERDGTGALEEDFKGVPPAVLLNDGKLLDANGVGGVLRANESRIIGLVGPNEAGKTTLVSSLYGLFLEGTLGRIRFARSLTLYEFERISHLGRARSRRASPRTERTSRAAGLGFFHLGIQDRESSHNVDLLFSERAGEDYRGVADDPSVAKSFPEITRADCIVLVIDGERLSDKTARHNVRSNTEMILQGLVDGNAVSREQRLAVVLTKYDIVTASSEKDRIESDFQRIIDKIERLFPQVFLEIRKFETAARPTDRRVLPGFGLRELVDYWLLPQAVPAYTATNAMRPRAFGRLQVLYD